MTPGTGDPAAAARRIIDTLRAAGHTALLAGGCVRDSLLGVAPKDYDVATDATPDRVVELFPRSRQVGAKFGVVLVRVGRHDVEVATFRRDGVYTDGRRPDSVSFGSEIEDARRRDFTINGLFYDPVADRVIDHVGGQEDLRKGVLRTIGEPDERFAEDHLRLLRAVRFAARLGFTIDPATFAAIGRHAHQLAGISVERVWLELEQILAAPSRAAGWKLLTAAGLRPWLCSAWTFDAAVDAIGLARLEVLPATALPAQLSAAALLADRPVPALRKIAASLRWSNRFRDDVIWLSGSLESLVCRSDLELADFKQLLAAPRWPDLLALLRADDQVRRPARPLAPAVAARAAAIPADRVAPPPLLTGDELTAAGHVPGPRLGITLEAVRRAQLNEEIDTREAAWEMAKKMMAEG